MKRIYVFLMALTSYGACDASPNTTILKGKISFVEATMEGKLVRKLTIELTDNIAETCIGKNWKKAHVINDIERYTKNPAYKIENGRMEILLVNNLCDSYDSYEGELTNQVFIGEHVRYGMNFSETIGKVSGTYSSK
jgi:hypothetical protein